MRKRTMILATVLGFMTYGSASIASPPINVTAPLPATGCVRASKFCEKTVVVGDLLFVDGDGNAASKVSGFTFNVIQFPSSGGNLLTEVVMNFNLENITVDKDTSVEYMHIKFLDKRGNYLSDVVSVGLLRDSSKCGKLQNLQALVAPVGDIFKKGAAKYEITQEKITGDILVC